MADLAPACAEQVKLPPTLMVTAYDTGTAGFNITVAIGKMMKDKYGTDMRVLPAGNDVARLQPLRARPRGDLRHGLRRLLRPGRRVRVRHQGMGPAAGPAHADDGRLQRRHPRRRQGHRRDQIADLKGKRVGFVVGSPALNQNSLGVLAFGDLTQRT